MAADAGAITQKQSKRSVLSSFLILFSY